MDTFLIMNTATCSYIFWRLIIIQGYFLFNDSIFKQFQWQGNKLVLRFSVFKKILIGNVIMSAFCFLILMICHLFFNMRHTQSMNKLINLNFTNLRFCCSNLLFKSAITIKETNFISDFS